MKSVRKNKYITEVYFFKTWETIKTHELFIAPLRLGCAVSFVAGQQNKVRKAKRNNCRDKNSTTEFSVGRLRAFLAVCSFTSFPLRSCTECFKAHMNPTSFWYHAKVSTVTSIRCYVILLVPLEYLDSFMQMLQSLSCRFSQVSLWSCTRGNHRMSKCKRSVSDERVKAGLDRFFYCRLMIIVLVCHKFLRSGADVQGLS